jgi:amino acid transporter
MHVLLLYPVFSFSRDGAIPGSRYWKQVNRKLDVPLNAMWLSTAVQVCQLFWGSVVTNAFAAHTGPYIVLGLIYFGSATAFNAFSGVGVICLGLSYWGTFWHHSCAPDGYVAD